MYYEELEKGMRFEFEPVDFPKKEIMEFSKKYDIVAVHWDEEIAKNSRYGSIIASGFHTLLKNWNRWLSYKDNNYHIEAGVGIESLKWLKPVYAGDMTTPVIEVINLKDTSNPRSGFIEMKLTCTNQEKEVVMIMDCSALIKKKSYQKDK